MFYIAHAAIGLECYFTLRMTIGGVPDFQLPASDIKRPPLGGEGRAALRAAPRFAPKLELGYTLRGSGT